MKYSPFLFAVICQQGSPRRGRKAASGPSSATAATLPPLSSTGTVSRRCLGSFWSIMIFFTVRPGRPGRSSRSPVLRGRTVSPSAPASQNSWPDWGSPWYTAAAQVRVHSPVSSCPGMGRDASSSAGGAVSRVSTSISYSRRAVMPSGRSSWAEGSLPRHRATTPPRWGAARSVSPSRRRASSSRAARGAKASGRSPTAAAGRRRVPARGRKSATAFSARPVR